LKMNPQQRFIEKIKGISDVPMSQEEKEIEIGMFRGGARPRRERSIDSGDFLLEEPEPKKKKPPKKKEYKRKPAKRLKSVAL